MKKKRIWYVLLHLVVYNKTLVFKFSYNVIFFKENNWYPVLYFKLIQTPFFPNL